VIVTLAGHVDHGKTSLVQALTGVNTDRLTEEKRRGLTIDLGFAYLEAGDVTLGFVDVPGHHRFIHNMVAGISSQQHALLVIAADDGPMPQSREHLQILDLLGIEHGTIALTKCDRVSSERRLEARREIAQLVTDSCLEDAEIVETSSETGEGLEQLRTCLKAEADRQQPPASDAGFRLPIDRAFTVAGAGVVVTGTVHSGTAEADQTLSLYPSMKSVRVKGLRAQNRIVDRACIGDRCALNIAGVEIDEVTRGQWLSTGTELPSQEFSIRLRVLDDFPRAVRHWLPVHVYHATSHTTGHVALLSERRIEPGTTELIEIITADPLLLRRGDRLILRDQGLDRTLGGGSVVSTQPADGRRRETQRLMKLGADAALSPALSLAAHLDIGAVDLSSFQRNWGLSDSALSILLSEEGCTLVEGHGVRETTWQRWLSDLSDEINQRHQADNALQGLKQSEVQGSAPAMFVSALLNQLVSEGKLTVRAGRFSPEQHRATLSEPEQQLFDKVESSLDKPQPPSLGDMAKQLRSSPGDLAKRLHPLVTKKYLVRISDTRYFLPAHLTVLAELAHTLAHAAPFTVRQYRDAAQIGRNVAIEVLEHFDRVGFTRRDGDTRQVVGDLSKVSG